MDSADWAVRAVAALGIGTNIGYVAWRSAGLGHNLWLSVPLLALEVWGLLQLCLLVLQGWTGNHHLPRPRSNTRSIDLVVTCTYHSAEDLERTLVACRAARHLRTVLVAMRPGRNDLESLATSMGARVFVGEGNHADIYWSAAKSLDTDLLGWLEAGQLPLPGFVEYLLPHFDDERVAVAQSGVGLLNKDSLAHVRGGRDEDAFRHQVAFPGQSAHGCAPWHGGASIVRVDALREVDAFAPNDQAALERSLIRLHAAGWKTLYHHDPPLVRDTAPDSLETYLLRRRRRAIESLRVFRTADSPLRRRRMPLRARLHHLALASAFGVGVRQLGLTIVLLATLLTGKLPIGEDVGIWPLVWGPTFVAGVATRHFLARGTMRIGDWTRQGWRTLSADLSALVAITGVYLTPTSFTETRTSGWRSLGKLRLLTLLLVSLEVTLVMRGLTVLWPGLLPRFSTSGRILTIGIGLAATISMIDVIQVSVRRSQRRSQFRLIVDLPVMINDRPARAVDLSPTGIGAVVGNDPTISIGSKVRLDLGLRSATGERLTIPLTAVARSETVTADGRRLGFEFGERSPAARAALIEHCAIAHHESSDSGDEHHLEPMDFDVAHAHPRAMRALSSMAVMLGLGGLFFGPASQAAFAGEAVTVSVCIATSDGTPIAGAVASFYDAQWLSLGETGADGCAVGLAPGTQVSFAVEYDGITNKIVQDTSTNPKIGFATIPVTVALSASTGKPIEGAEALYYAQSWKPVGTTGPDGTATKELLPANLSFAVKYDGITNKIVQDTNTNPKIGFSGLAIAKTEPLEVSTTPAVPSAPQPTPTPLAQAVPTPQVEAVDLTTTPPTATPVPAEEDAATLSSGPAPPQSASSEPPPDAQVVDPATVPEPAAPAPKPGTTGDAPRAVPPAQQQPPPTEPEPAQNSDLGPTIAVELAFEDPGGSGWTCAASSTVLRCENSGATAGFSTGGVPTVRDIGQPALLVGRSGRVGDVAVALAALGLMWIALSLAHRFPRRRRSTPAT